MISAQIPNSILAIDVKRGDFVIIDERPCTVLYTTENFMSGGSLIGIYYFDTFGRSQTQKAYHVKSPRRNRAKEFDIFPVLDIAHIRRRDLSILDVSSDWVDGKAVFVVCVEDSEEAEGMKLLPLPNDTVQQRDMIQKLFEGKEKEKEMLATVISCRGNVKVEHVKLAHATDAEGEESSTVKAEETS